MSRNSSVNSTSVQKLIKRAKSVFWEDLYSFYRSSRAPFSYCPRISGHNIELHQLFVAVIQHGGYKHICENGLWNSVAKTIGLSPNCVNNSVALRRIYYKCLGAYERERVPSLSDRYLDKQLIESGQDVAIIPKYIPPTAFECSVGISYSQRPEAISNNTLICPASIGGQQELELLNGRFKTQENPIIRTLHSCVIPPWSSALSGEVNVCQDGLSGDVHLREQSELQMIEFALLSGLENEIDLALNSLLILSSTCGSSKSTPSIRLSRCQNLLRLLLASVGIYDDHPASLIQCDNLSRQLSFQSFWNSMVHGAEGRQFLNQDVFIDPGQDDGDQRSIDSDEQEAIFAPPLKLDQSSQSLSFVQGAFEETLEQSRVMVIATILVNLTSQPVQNSLSGRAPVHGDGSLDDEDDLLYEQASATYSHGEKRSRTLCAPQISSSRSNGVTLKCPPVPPLSQARDNCRTVASSPSALRFAFLCAYARHSGLKQLGMQLLGSLQFPLRPPQSLRSELDAFLLACDSEATEMWRTPWSVLCAVESHDAQGRVVNNGCRLDRLTVQFIVSHVCHSQDRADILTGLSMLANLSRVPEEENATPLIDLLPERMWTLLPQLLCLPDLGLVCATLEALLGLTSLGLLLCQPIFFSAPNTLMDALFSIVNMEGQVMGAGSLHRIKLMQRIPPPPSASMNVPSLPMQQMLHQHHTNSQHPQSYVNKPLPKMQQASPSLIGLLSSPTSQHQHENPKSPPRNEITDRLQMPPPSLPPPSLLRKSLKQSSVITPQRSMPPPLTNGHQQLTPISNGPSSHFGHKRSRDQHEQLPNQKINESPEPIIKKHINGMCNGQVNGASATPPTGGESDDSNDSLEDFVVSAKKANKNEKRNGNSKKCNGSDSGSSQDSGVMDSHLEPLEDLEDEEPPDNGSDLDEDLHDDGISSYSDSEIEEYAMMAELLGPDSPNSSGSEQTPAPANLRRFICEWGSACHTSFDAVQEISAHVYSRHLRVSDEVDERRKRYQCQWQDCPSAHIPRARFALISHVLEHHCQEAEMQQRRRIRLGLEARPRNIGSQGPSSNHDASGWAVLRAMELKRQQNEYWIPHMNPAQYGRLIGKNHAVLPPVLPPREGPVTKHLRVTAALVLQNLCLHLQEARQWVVRESSVLCEIAFGCSPSVPSTSGNGGCMLKTNDAAHIVARCLHLALSTAQKPQHLSVNEIVHS
ncbi:transcription initiation factor TFIID subunit 8 [Cichlidogyrus casuarinus]|uniref:Transcription initiation factor TFIID subunit 8 n=1 Tax=Cichlidogyrus casuarinus TaxID=1844966 RepID=A0ABD2QDW1_9PLAT